VENGYGAHVQSLYALVLDSSTASVEILDAGIACRVGAMQGHLCGAAAPHLLQELGPRRSVPTSLARICSGIVAGETARYGAHRPALTPDGRHVSLGQESHHTSSRGLPDRLVTFLPVALSQRAGMRPKAGLVPARKQLGT
jgi:hypothetical protein